MLTRSEGDVFGYGVSRQADPAAAVTEALTEIDLPGTAFLLVYMPPGMALEPLETALTEQVQGVTTFGCTTAGTITDQGYEDAALMVLAFPKRHFRCASTLIAPLSDLVISDVATQVARTAEKFAHSAGWNRFALIMADGLSLQEDLFVSAVEAGLTDVPVFGGSAGDGLSFGETHVLHGGKFWPNAGLLILIECDLGFVGLGFDHFLPTERRVVVTHARPTERHVCELNGSPAAQEYARLVGCTPEDLSPEVFAENPLLVRNGDSFHVRAVQQVEERDCLSFLSAIDDGLVLTLGQGTNCIEVLQDGLDVRDPAGRSPCMVLGFECILRRLEFDQKNISGEVSDILRDANVRGFCTYGEQHRGVHVNQTFVGVAFYPPDDPPRYG